MPFARSKAKQASLKFSKVLPKRLHKASSHLATAVDQCGERRPTFTIAQHQRIPLGLGCLDAFSGKMAYMYPSVSHY